MTVDIAQDLVQEVPLVAQQKYLWRGVLLLGLLVMAVLPCHVLAEELSTGVIVEDISICRTIDRTARTPVGSATHFSADIDRLYCFTRLTGAYDPTTITHVWFHEGRTRAHVSLDVTSPNWRTWSSKALLPVWTGSWEVRVLDEHGIILKSIAFEVTDDSDVEEGQ